MSDSAVDQRPERPPSAYAATRFAVRRLDGNPILARDATPGVGRNINGPSLIAAPPWLEDPLGRYYLYFAHHRGTYIRLATADRLEGPWRVHEQGTLRLAGSHFPTHGRRAHIASPDVHVDPATRTVRMYYHGLDTVTRVQHTRVAISCDGVEFTAREELLGRPYLRAFAHDGWWYALAMPGILYRSADGLTAFERGPRLFEGPMRHCALLPRGDELLVFLSRVGDSPERILCSAVALDGDWRRWRAGPAQEVLEPERAWEGAGLPLAPSVRGWVDEPVRQLRDPAIFEEDGRTYLLYSVAGESGIAIAELESPGATSSAPALRAGARRIVARLRRLDPGLARLREAGVTIVAALASFACALLIRNAAHLSASVEILAIALALSMGRLGQRADHRGPGARALAAVLLPVIAAAATEIGTLLVRHPDLGDTLFVLALSATIWVRRFGTLARRIATIATLPLVAILIVPAPVAVSPGSSGDARWWSALVALIAVGSVTVARLAAVRAGLLPAGPPAPGPVPPPAPPAPPRAGRRPLASTRMAVQMAAALGAAFATGRSLFGVHWTWVVLSAFIVCSGNRGRGDVAHKALMRVAGAGLGTLSATVLAGALAPGLDWSIVAIFAVLAVALWLRPLSYAYWAAGMTAALALLYGYYGERGTSLLGTRLEAVALGAALGVAASWLLLPVRTTDVLRRDISRALIALQEYLAALVEDPSALAAAQARLTAAVAALEHSSRLLRRLPVRLRERFAQPAAVAALERCAAAAPAVTARAERSPAPLGREGLGGLRAEAGELRRANAQRAVAEDGIWAGFAERFAQLAHAGPARAPEPAGDPHGDRLWASSERVLGYVNRTHATSYRLLRELGRDGSSATFLIEDDSGRRGQLSWSREPDRPAAPGAGAASPDAGASTPGAGASTPGAGASTPGAGEIRGLTPSGYPYALREAG
jgi:Fusaric acid resistance protein-like